MGQEFYGGEYPVSLEELGHITIAIKCPLFVQLALSKYDLRIIDANNGNKIEAFIPNAGQIRASDAPTSEAISDDISRTTDALLINPKAYASDGCDPFVAQVITPINVYSTLIVGGKYSEWCKFAYQQRLPEPIEAYAKAIGQIIEAEWK